MMLDTLGTWMQSAYLLSALVLGLASGLTCVLARRTASVRHHVWVVALGVTLVSPVAREVVPRLDVPLLRPGEVAGPRRSIGVTTAEAFRPETIGDEHTRSASRWSAAAIAALVWIIGAVPLLCVRTLRRIRLSRLVAEASAVDAQADVRSHARVSVPMLAGLRRPTILLPVSAAEWPVDAREAVLAHERAHAQRHDHVIALVSDVATSVYWLNPLAWIAAVAIEREREAACDEEVLRAGIKPSVYAAALLRVAQTLPARGTAAAAPSIAGGRLDARIRAVLQRAPNSGRVPLSWPATMALIGVCAMLAASVRLVARTPPQTIAGLGSTDGGDFCCPDYLRTMVDRIRSNWGRQAERPAVFCRPSREACRGTVQFTIQRDGTISKVRIEKRSGYRTLDADALTAVRLAGKLSPLPAAFPKPTLTVHFGFAASSEPATLLEDRR